MTSRTRPSPSPASPDRLKTLLGQGSPLERKGDDQKISGYPGRGDQPDAGDGLKHPSCRPRTDRQPDRDSEKALRDQQRGHQGNVEGQYLSLRRDPFRILSRCAAIPYTWNAFWTICSTMPPRPFPCKGGVSPYGPMPTINGPVPRLPIRGLISGEDRLRLLEGEGRGRGIHITHRIVRLLKGQLEVKVEDDSTTMIVRFPMSSEGAVFQKDARPT